MMKAANSEQMRRIDREAEALYKIPGIVLMENAGLKVFKHITCVDGWENKNICFIAGRGNNGGDGFAAARHVYSCNKNIVIYTTASEESLKGDALVNYNIIKNMGICINQISEISDIEMLKESIKTSGIIVDGLLGTGVKGEVTSLYREIISAMNTYGEYIISIDIPSGVDADNGRVLGIGVRADCTVTFALPKVGLYMYPGAEHCGNIFVEDISIPEELIDKQDIDVYILTADDVKGCFKKRPDDAHKGTYGRAFITAGSKDMAGAAIMCIKSALKSGAGIVEAAVPECIRGNVVSSSVEAIVKGVGHEDGCISIDSWKDIKEGMLKSDAFAVGPGLSASKNIKEMVNNIVGFASIPGVIDADGLNALVGDLEMLYNAKSTIILTPHPGEMARLTRMTAAEVQSDRIGCALEFSKKYNVVTVLKGANTVIASTDGHVYINTTGNPGMAKGGSGDVLTGMIVSLLAQGIEPIEAVKAGVYIHGLAGDMAAEAIGEYGMGAMDIVDYIPDAIRKVSTLLSYV